MASINIDSSTYILSVVSASTWGIRISSKTDFGLGSTGVPDYPYFAADRRGSGNDTWDVTFLANAQYLAELFETGEGVVDQVAFTKTTPPANYYLNCSSATSNFCQQVSGAGTSNCTTVGVQCADTAKEYVFEFGAAITTNTMITLCIQKIVSLLSGKSSYIEGTKLIVVM